MLKRHVLIHYAPSGRERTAWWERTWKFWSLRLGVCHICLWRQVPMYVMTDDFGSIMNLRKLRLCSAMVEHFCNSLLFKNELLGEVRRSIANRKFLLRGTPFHCILHCRLAALEFWLLTVPVLQGESLGAYSPSGITQTISRNNPCKHSAETPPTHSNQSRIGKYWRAEPGIN